MTYRKMIHSNSLSEEVDFILFIIMIVKPCKKTKNSFISRYGLQRFLNCEIKGKNSILKI